jgi:hypothetical protein
MENLTIEELVIILQWRNSFAEKNHVNVMHEALKEKVLQAIADKEFEEKTRPLNF